MHDALPSKTASRRPPVRVITVNWNNGADTERLLAALRALNYPAFDIVVVDNGSTDGSLQRLQESFPEAGYVSLPANLGFGAANNAALRRTLADNIPFAWLINNDALPEPDALERLVARMEAEPGAGAAGALVLEDGPGGRAQAWGGARLHPWLGYARRNRSAAETPDFITGACLLLRMDAVRGTGLFDERFFLYWEDADLCFRLKQAGWAMTVADARVRHKGAATARRKPGDRSRHILHGFCLLMAKHESWAGAKSLSATIFQSFGKLLRRNMPAAAGCWEGWRSARNACRPSDRAAPG